MWNSKVRGHSKVCKHSGELERVSGALNLLEVTLSAAEILGKKNLTTLSSLANSTFKCFEVWQALPARCTFTKHEATKSEEKQKAFSCPYLFCKWFPLKLGSSHLWQTRDLVCRTPIRISPSSWRSEYFPFLFNPFRSAQRFEDWYWQRQPVWYCLTFCSCKFGLLLLEFFTKPQTLFQFPCKVFFFFLVLPTWQSLDSSFAFRSALVLYCCHERSQV